LTATPRKNEVGASMPLAVVVLAAVELRDDLRKADRVDLVHAARARVVADLGRVSGDGQHVAHTLGVRAERQRLEAHDRGVARGDVRDRLDPAVALDRDEAISAFARARAIGLSLMSTKPTLPERFSSRATASIAS
jgi:hypothetical protein